jgi:8-amino-3,8-dideoxy-alpha-D-manno-octulosonate transaminase
MASIPGGPFRKIPDEAGDSATFLSFFLPTEERARGAAKDLAKAGVDGCFYWYDNNWHYIRQWEHLKKMASAARLPATLYEHCPDYGALKLPRSDSIMGRMISMQIKLSWTSDDITKRIDAVRGVLM